MAARSTTKTLPDATWTVLAELEAPVPLAAAPDAFDASEPGERRVRDGPPLQRKLCLPINPVAEVPAPAAPPVPVAIG